MPKKNEKVSENICVKSRRISKKDKIYEEIQLKLNNNEILCEEEKIYLSIYNDCKKELKVDDFSLIQYKNNHTSGTNSIIKKTFHKSLKKLTKEQRKIFFEFYEFLPCMTICSNLID